MELAAWKRQAFYKIILQLLIEVSATARDC